jgi:hypothetical protein
LLETGIAAILSIVAATGANLGQPGIRGTQQWEGAPARITFVISDNRRDEGSLFEAWRLSTNAKPLKRLKTAMGSYWK